MTNFQFDDIMTSTEDSAERCYVALEELTLAFSQNYDDRMKQRLAADYRRYRVLLAIAFRACAEIFETIERYNQLIETNQDTQEKPL